MNEIDCSIVQGIIEFNASDGDDDENEQIEMINNVYWVDISVGNGVIFPVVDTNELDCSVVDRIIELYISDDVDDDIMLLEMINKFGWVDFSVQIGEICSGVDTNEIDCSFVDGFIEVNVSDDVVDQIMFLEKIYKSCWVDFQYKLVK